ncbi:MAG: hypothetical protein ABW168_23940 [Sedimenticola sp.]
MTTKSSTSLSAHYVRSVCIALLITFAYCTAVSAGGWNTYKGAWFTIDYPDRYIVRESLLSNTRSNAYDSVFFRSELGGIEFYVFSPQWGGRPRDVEIQPANEYLISHRVKSTPQSSTHWYTIGDKKRNYVRSYVDRTNSIDHSRVVIGVKYADYSTYFLSRDKYLRFKKSLRQFSD